MIEYISEMENSAFVARLPNEGKGFIGTRWNMDVFCLRFVFFVPDDEDSDVVVRGGIDVNKKIEDYSESRWSKNW